MESTIQNRRMWGIMSRLGEKLRAELSVHPLELAAVTAGFLALWVGLGYIAGGPIYSDELWYLQAGLNNVPATNVLNRYFHIYLQKLFVELAPSPLIGVQFFWGFLVAATAGMVYWIARLLSKENTIIHGLLAVAFFFTFRVIADYSGITVVDITAMFMLTMILGLYLYVIRFDASHPWAVVLLGALFFLALKTKETTIICGLLVLGFGFDHDGSWSLRRLRPYLVQLAAGFGLGIGVLILLNTFVLGLPLFGLTPAYLREFAGQLATSEGLNTEAADWYTGYLLPAAPLVFVLYLLSGAKQRAKLSPAVMLVWLLPLAFILFLSFSMVKGDWGIRARHLFPILPVFASLAPQFLNVELPKLRREKLWLAGSLVVVVLLPLAMRSGLLWWLARLEGDITVFILNVVFPVLFSCLLAVLVWFERFSYRTAAVPLALIAVLIFSPLSSNLKEIFLVRSVAGQYENRVYPLASFSEQFNFREDVRILVSMDSAAWMGNPNASPDIMLSLFNFYFNTNTARENFAFAVFNEAETASVLGENYDYLLFSQHDWNFLLESLDDRAELDELYETLVDPKGLFYLLLRR
jgi:hypothetical protein